MRSILTLHRTTWIHTSVTSTLPLIPCSQRINSLAGSKAAETNHLRILWSSAQSSQRPLNSQHTASATRLGGIAEYAVEKNHGKFSLQLVQSRTLLALCYFTHGDFSKAWDYCGEAARAGLGLGLNREEAITNVEDDQAHEYGLNNLGLVECRRRTFWSVYLIDVSLFSLSTFKIWLIVILASPELLIWSIIGHSRP